AAGPTWRRPAARTAPRRKPRSRRSRRGSLADREGGVRPLTSTAKCETTANRQGSDPIASRPNLRIVRMLPALVLGEPLGRHVVLGARAGQAGDRRHERQTALEPELLYRHHTARIVEAAERDRHAVPVDVAEGQR